MVLNLYYIRWSALWESEVQHFRVETVNVYQGVFRANHLIIYALPSSRSIRRGTNLSTRGLSLAASSAALQLGHPISFLSFSAVLLQVFLGLPLFRLPSGVQVRATWVWVLSLRTWLLILSGQNTRNILLRHLFWNASHFFMSATVIFQHSDPYISIDLTLLL